MLDNGSAPQAVKDEFNLAEEQSVYKCDFTPPSPTEKIVRGDATGTGTNENYSNAMRDAAAAYQLSLLWKLTGDTKVRRLALHQNSGMPWVKVSKKLLQMDSNHMLAAGAQGYAFANAGGNHANLCRFGQPMM